MSAIKKLSNGTFDVQDSQGKSLLDRMGGPFSREDVAIEAKRMLDSFDQVDRQIADIIQKLRVDSL